MQPGAVRQQPVAGGHQLCVQAGFQSASLHTWLCPWWGYLPQPSVQVLDKVPVEHDQLAAEDQEPVHLMLLPASTQNEMCGVVEELGQLHHVPQRQYQNPLSFLTLLRSLLQLIFDF